MNNEGNSDCWKKDNTRENCHTRIFIRLFYA